MAEGRMILFLILSGPGRSRRGGDGAGIYLGINNTGTTGYGGIKICRARKKSAFCIIDMDNETGGAYNCI